LSRYGVVTWLLLCYKKMKQAEKDNKLKAKQLTEGR